MGTIDAIIQSIKKYIPDHYYKLSEALEKEENETSAHIEKAYSEIQNISFDNGVLENVRNHCMP